MCGIVEMASADTIFLHQDGAVQYDKLRNAYRAAAHNKPRKAVQMALTPPIPPTNSRRDAPAVLGDASRTWPLLEATGELLPDAVTFVGVVELVAFFAPRLVPGAAISEENRFDISAVSAR